MTTQISSVLSSKSRYVQGGQTEIGSIGLEWWERYSLPTDPSDQLYIVEDKYSRRPDLIANAFYSDIRLSWVICQFNNILDPYDEIVTGTILYIPTLERVQLMFNQKPGGIKSKMQEALILPPIVL